MSEDVFIDMLEYDEQPPDEGLDELCVRMLSLGAMGGCTGGTDELRASEIKTLLVPFFGLDRINRCTAALCGENSQADARATGPTDS